MKGDEGGGGTVLVGVKFDADSNELLTWALVKVAQPGDQIIALHILDAATECPASILSLVKTFDYTLAVYEGFCNLKQVDLKLKVCRGPSPKRILVREAKSFETTKLILGTSKTHNPLQSPASVAKFCARKLSNCFSVYAVRNGKVVFQREAIQTNLNQFQENMVGRGGSSHVYKGCLPDGKELAVKIVKPTEHAIKEFVQEIEIITSLNHKNLISLFGFCFEQNKLLLVYDFLSRGSLEENLHGNKKDGNAFGWQERYKVAVGLAEALDYLHNSCEQPVIHRDVKSSNVLLSNDFEPQAKPILKDCDSSQLLDPQLGSGCEFHEIERMVLAATLCIRRSPLMRPQISLILKLLQGDQEVANWAEQEVRTSEEVDVSDEELYPTNIESHLNLALLDLEDDSVSASSDEQSLEIEDYLQKRWRRSSSFA